jgi:hypothetical protein
LPPAVQKLFDNLNKTLTNMGVSGVTEAEAKLLLKALIPMTLENQEEKAVEAKATASMNFRDFFAKLKNI